MAVSRLSLTTIRDLCRLHLGVLDESHGRVRDSDQSTDTASLTAIINQYGQSIPQKLGSLMLQHGTQLEYSAAYPDFWKTTSTSLGEAVGSQDITLPADYARVISLWDNSMGRRISINEESDMYRLDRYRRAAPGPPKVCEIMGVNSSGVWTGKLWPQTPDGNTPDLTLTYWRIPAIMPDTDSDAEYPDAPANFHLLWVYGPVADIMRADDPAFTRFQEKEREMLLELLRISRAS